MKIILLALGVIPFFSLVALAQTAQPVTPGYLSVTNCPGGNTPCFFSYTTASGAFSGASVGAAHGNVLAAANRTYLLLENVSAAGGNTIYCSFGGTATVNGAGTIAIAPGQIVTWESSFIPNDAIDCIATGASTPLSIGAH